jgi:hypothetical protein
VVPGFEPPLEQPTAESIAALSTTRATAAGRPKDSKSLARMEIR